MKKLQFKRVNDTLGNLLGTQIISEGFYKGNTEIIKMGFYTPIPHSFKYYVIFNRITGSYSLATEDSKRNINIISCEEYKISGLRKLLKNEFYNMIYQREIQNIFLKNN